MKKTEEIKLMIIENFIEHFTTNEEERDLMKKDARLYVKEDWVDEIAQAFPIVNEKNDEQKKSEQIDYIKKVINKHGSFTTADVEASSSPCINSIQKDSCTLLENFDTDKATAVSYIHETETGEDFILYEDLDNDIIEEIVSLTEDWEADQLQIEKRISN